MDGPDEQLMELYGTELLMKEAKQDNLTQMQKLLTALAGFGLMMSFSKGVKDQEEEADQLNQIMREIEAKRMEATLNSMKIGSAYAEDVGEQMAKAAFGVPILSTLGKAGKLVGKIPAKGKLLKGGLMAGGAYGTYKGLQALSARASRPGDQGPQRWGHRKPMQNISEYGYPTP